MTNKFAHTYPGWHVVMSRSKLVDKYIYLVTREQNDAKEHAPHVGHNSRYNTRAMQKGDIIGSSKRSGGRMH